MSKIDPQPKFDYDIPYDIQGVIRLDPMTAKEIDDEGTQNALLADPNYIVEEKLDGVRMTLHFYAPHYIHRFRETEFTKVINEHVIPFIYYTSFWGKFGESIYHQFVTEGKISGEYLLTLPDLNSDYPDIMGSNICALIKRDTLYVGYSPNKLTHFGMVLLGSVLTELLKRFMLYPQKGCCRLFSRRVSDVTGWLSENTDLFPHFRDLNIPELNGTVLDGEMKVSWGDFSDISSIINSNPDKAVATQEDRGYATFNAFDITHFKGIDVRSMPLSSRKVLLRYVCDKVLSCGQLPEYSEYYLKNLPSYSCSEEIPVTMTPSHYKRVKSKPALYPNLYEVIKKKLIIKPTQLLVSPKGYYEFIVSSGGEGVMIKSSKGRYFSKRCREYQKIKKIISRDMIILGFEEPTKVYSGKFPNDSWDYWEAPLTKISMASNNWSSYSAKSLLSKGYTPVTRHYAEGMVGNMILGVIVSPDEERQLRNLSNKKNRFGDNDFIDINGMTCAVMCICSGYTDEVRAQFTENPPIGKVAEIKANDLFKDTGKLRHPRFLRLREDKSPKDCTFKEHIAQTY